MPHTIAARTRRVYDLVSSVYPVSTYFFHSKAHDCALRHSGIRNGMRVLEVATGSGEMFRRLVKANPDGRTFGLDLSPIAEGLIERLLCHLAETLLAQGCSVVGIDGPCAE